VQINFQSLADACAADPNCWLKYRAALPADEGSIGGTVIFLHECVSPHGSRRLVALRMRPNIDHAQMCSIDATVVVPATFSSTPVSNYKVVKWVPGWFLAERRWDDPFKQPVALHETVDELLHATHNRLPGRLWLFYAMRWKIRACSNCERSPY
jgi:hypothetical protein